jgi:hypothetical protein
VKTYTRSEHTAYHYDGHKPADCPFCREITPEWSDEDLIDYCASHCKTERALFHREHILRIWRLAGEPPQTNVYDLPEWVTAHEDSMMPLVTAARARRKKPEPPSTNDKAIARVRLLDGIVKCAAPVLTWDRAKAEAWLPGLYDALTALKAAEEEPAPSRCAECGCRDGMHYSYCSKHDD